MKFGVSMNFKKLLTIHFAIRSICKNSEWINPGRGQTKEYDVSLRCECDVTHASNLSPAKECERGSNGQRLCNAKENKKEFI